MPSVPLSRLERGIPPPRSKSCTACIKAKRRCDREHPKCARCANRHLACDYPQAPRRTALPPRRDSREERESLVNIDTVAAGEHYGAPTGSAEREVDDPASEALRNADYYVSTDNWQVPGFPGSFGDDEMLGFGLDGLDFALSLPPVAHDPPTSLVCSEPPLSIQRELLPPQDFDFNAITERMERNLSYAVEQIKHAPRAMLLETRTPWCHISLYKRAMPRAMQDALSACALYESKNAVNSPVIIRCINTKVADLLRSALPTERLEVLSHTQSLMLYQIIRFFDGDIIARSSAEATFSQLDSSSRSLYGHIDWNPDAGSRASGCGGNDSQPITSLALQTAVDVWHDWVFQESARRTYLIARFFLTVWKLLTRQGTGCQENAPVNQEERWTLSAHLWQASDPVEFAAAWAGKKHFVVRRKAVLSTLADATCDDVEDFGKMILTTAMGITQAKVWLASIGATL